MLTDRINRRSEKCFLALEVSTSGREGDLGRGDGLFNINLMTGSVKLSGI